MNNDYLKMILIYLVLEFRVLALQLLDPIFQALDKVG